VDLLSINALRWEMIGEKYDPYRDTEAFTPSPSARSALQHYLTRGGALLGLHTASICFSDWPEWQSLLGGRWVWGSSWHPAPEPVTITIEPDTVLSHLPAFTVHDELYSDLALEPDTTVLATGVSHAMVTPQPVIWQREVGQGRVVYDALGHDRASLNHPTHAQLLRDAAQWALYGENPS
jgi:type 1 glutamine amidotransferase